MEPSVLLVQIKKTFVLLIVVLRRGKYDAAGNKDERGPLVANIFNINFTLTSHRTAVGSVSVKL